MMLRSNRSGQHHCPRTRTSEWWCAGWHQDREEVTLMKEIKIDIRRLEKVESTAEPRCDICGG